MSNFPPPDVTVLDLELDPRQPAPQYFLVRVNWLGGLPPTPPPFGMAADALGIDISHWQSQNKPAINWPMVKEVAKVKYVFIKASEGTFEIDDFLASHREGARAVGLPYGFYHYIRAGVPGATQADYFLTSLAGDVGNLPLVIDVEEGAPTLIELRRCVDRIKERVDGKEVMIYTRGSMWQELGGQSQTNPDFSDCLLWVSHPNATTPILPSDWTSYDFWQINWTARLPGISGAVDVNKYAGALPRPWWVRDFTPGTNPVSPPRYKAQPKVSGAPVTLHKAPHGDVDRILDISWTVDVTEITLDGWLRVNASPPLWGEEKNFKV